MKEKIIYLFQILSLLAMWTFSLGIGIWIIHLMRMAQKLDDSPTASAAISLVAIPVFLIGSGVLTYVFVGLQRGKHEE